jgi:hypothetical protein
MRVERFLKGRGVNRHFSTKFYFDRHFDSRSLRAKKQATPS